mmetsp:Transcript_9160/g.29703  ORF Transcript_9160/g.29703 Transcript_9160/m.29703 type:complete len:101 (-) Transcript_9160:195-497(-)
MFSFDLYLWEESVPVEKAVGKALGKPSVSDRREKSAPPVFIEEKEPASPSSPSSPSLAPVLQPEAEDYGFFVSLDDEDDFPVVDLRRPSLDIGRPLFALR